MWPHPISAADIAAVPSPLVEKDSFLTGKDALEHPIHTHTHAHTHSLTQAPLSSERKLLSQKMASFEEENEKIRLTEEHKAKGNSEGSGVPAITSPRHTHTHAHARTHEQEQAALWPLTHS